MDDDFHLKPDILDRTYLYRFAVRKDSLLSQENSDYFQSTKGETYFHSKIRVDCTAKDYYLPVQDQSFIAEIKGPFSPEKAKKCLKMFEGTHNHYDLTAASARLNKYRNEEGKYVKAEYPLEFFQREIYETTFEQVPPPISETLVPAYKLFDFYQFTVRGPAFYRNQIRRMASLVFDVASGKIGLSHISMLFEGQSKINLPALAQPCGLYLIKSRYKDEILKNHSTDDVSKLPFENQPSDADICARFSKANGIKPIEWDKMDVPMKLMEKIKANHDIIESKRDNDIYFIKTPTDEPDIEINKKQL